MRDGTGRAAMEAAAHRLPWPQWRRLMAGLAALAPLVRAGVPNRATPELVHNAPELADRGDPRELAHHLAEARIGATSVQGRRMVAAALTLWILSRKIAPGRQRKAWRGGHRKVEGFCAGAVSWGVPQADGRPWSRSTLWGPSGPFRLIGAHSTRLGRADKGYPGLGIMRRWQPDARAPGVITGPVHEDGRAYALAVHRYDAPMCGRSLAAAAAKGNALARRSLALALGRTEDDEQAEAAAELTDAPPAPEEAAPPPELAELVADLRARAPPD